MQLVIAGMCLFGIAWFVAVDGHTKDRKSAAKIDKGVLSPSVIPSITAKTAPGKFQPPSDARRLQTTASSDRVTPPIPKIKSAPNAIAGVWNPGEIAPVRMRSINASDVCTVRS